MLVSGRVTFRPHFSIRIIPSQYLWRGAPLENTPPWLPFCLWGTEGNPKSPQTVLTEDMATLGFGGYSNRLKKHNGGVRRKQYQTTTCEDLKGFFCCLFSYLSGHGHVLVVYFDSSLGDNILRDFHQENECWMIGGITVPKNRD